jgi:hypothetical protein
VAVLFRLAYLGVTNAVALLLLLIGSSAFLAVPPRGRSTIRSTARWVNLYIADLTMVSQSSRQTGCSPGKSGF